MIAEKQIHEHGFVRLIEVQGSDELIENAARLSYGEGTRKTSETRGLLRYLMRHKHTSPFEMAGVIFHIKLPIFIMRQLVRHRTASLNEYSARYSEMSDEFYYPQNTHLAPQSKSNKQGRAEESFTTEECEEFRMGMTDVCNFAYQTYEALLEGGVSRELARAVLPVSNYTQCFWKMNLHNLFHFLGLRTDKHAQQEIRDFADAILEMIEPYFPLSTEAWRDYVKNSRNLSALDIRCLRDYMLFRGSNGAEAYGMSKREHDEFVQWIENSVVTQTELSTNDPTSAEIIAGLQDEVNRLEQELQKARQENLNLLGVRSL